MTSSRAATRGSTFLPEAVAGATKRIVVRHQRSDERGHLLGEPIRQMRGIGDQHLADARQLGSGVSGGLQPEPATSTCTSPPSALAAVSALAVAA